MRLWLHALGLQLLLFCGSLDATEQTIVDRGIDRESQIIFPTECIPYTFNIDSLPYEELTNTTYRGKLFGDSTDLLDGDGIILVNHKGRLYYHPVNMSHKAYALVAAYRKTGDSTYLNQADKYVRRLVKESDEFDGALYYPYRMNHNVHSLREASLTAPWYSGMAQGEILGLLVRMYWATGDSVYISYARKTFKSFLRPRGKFEPWTVFIDSLGCYWIEEYPTENPSMTLNGFIYSLYGVYDYYLLTGNDDARKVLTDCLSTLKNYLPAYRRPGRASWYNLQYKYWSQPYHGAHVQQLRQLYKITHDDFFKEWSEIFRRDFH